MTAATARWRHAGALAGLIGWRTAAARVGALRAAATNWHTPAVGRAFRQCRSMMEREAAATAHGTRVLRRWRAAALARAVDGWRASAAAAMATRMLLRTTVVAWLRRRLAVGFRTLAQGGRADGPLATARRRCDVVLAQPRRRARFNSWRAAAGAAIAAEEQRRGGGDLAASLGGACAAHVGGASTRGRAAEASAVSVGALQRRRRAAPLARRVRRRRASAALCAPLAPPQPRPRLCRLGCDAAASAAAWMARCVARREHGAEAR